jgi:hypothetical protein
VSTRPTISCRELVALVTDYLEGTLPSSERIRFERHIAVCPPCRAHLEQMRDTIRVSGALATESPDVRVRRLEGRLNAYKFLGPGARGLYSGFRWPTPPNGRPGDWVEVAGRLEPGANGVHALRTRWLVDWIDDELWLVELAGDVEEGDDMLVARRGRLLERIPAWDEGAARELCDDCIRRARDIAADSLGRADLPRVAAALLDADGPDSLQELAAVEARNATGAAADALVFLADVVQVSRGGWFETYVDRAVARSRATPGGIAANVAFVVATAAGTAAADAAGRPDAFDDGWDAERGRQVAWLTERLGLHDL